MNKKTIRFIEQTCLHINRGKILFEREHFTYIILAEDEEEDEGEGWKERFYFHLIIILPKLPSS